ncbi:MAG: TolC family protein [Nitrospinae bacterium]|nr:TolC family protein [Nitrospinota bacterium]
MMWFWGLLFSFSATLSPLSAGAITLSEALAIAMENNLEVRVAAAQKTAADESLSMARAGFMPTVEVSETYSKTNNPMYAFGARLNQERIAQQDFEPSALNNPEAMANWKTAVSLRQPLFAGGQIHNEYRKAESAARIAELDLGQTRREVAFRVVEGWLNLSLLNKSLETLEHSKSLALESLKVARNRVDAGMALNSDLLDMQINYERVRKEINATLANIQLAKSALKTLLGAGELSPQFGEYTFEPGVVDVDESLKVAYENRADLQKTSAGVAMAGYDVKSAAGGFLPSVGLAADYEWNQEDLAKTGGESYMVAVEARWNLFSGGRDAARYKAARAVEEAHKFHERLLKDSIRTEVERDISGLKTAVENSVIALRQVSLAEESHRIISQQFIEGLKSSADLLASETQLERARLNKIASDHEMLLSRAKLDLTLGLDSGSIKEKR